MFIAYEVSFGQTLAGSADVPVRKERVPASSGCPLCVCNADQDCPHFQLWIAPSGTSVV